MQLAATAPDSEACRFLNALAENNRREWFRERRAEYRRVVAEPIAAMAEALGEAMAEVDPELTHSVSRPYRDMRFARPGRGPLHEAAWFVFHNRRLSATMPPAFFFEVSAGGFKFGMGYYSMPPRRMAAIRQAIDRSPGPFRRVARQALRVEGLAVCGTPYARPRGGHLPEELRPWYDRKCIHVEARRAADLPGTCDAVATAFGRLGPLYRFWRDAQ